MTHHVQARVTSPRPGKGEIPRLDPFDALVFVEFHETVAGSPIRLPFLPELSSIFMIGVHELFFALEGYRTDGNHDIGWPVGQINVEVAGPVCYHGFRQSMTN